MSTDDGEPMYGKIWMFPAGYSWAQIGDVQSSQPLTRYPINQTNDREGRFSFHAKGVNEAFLDGSVRFLDESTDLLVLMSLVSRSGEGLKRFGY